MYIRPKATQSWKDVLARKVFNWQVFAIDTTEKDVEDGWTTATSTVLAFFSKGGKAEGSLDLTSRTPDLFIKLQSALSYECELLPGYDHEFPRLACKIADYEIQLMALEYT